MGCSKNNVAVIFPGCSSIHTHMGDGAKFHFLDMHWLALPMIQITFSENSTLKQGYQVQTIDNFSLQLLRSIWFVIWFVIAPMQTGARLESFALCILTYTFTGFYLTIAYKRKVLYVQVHYVKLFHLTPVSLWFLEFPAALVFTLLHCSSILRAKTCSHFLNYICC